MSVNVNAELQRIYTKTLEVNTLLLEGKTIVAHQKLGGVIKNLSALLQATVNDGETLENRPQ